MNRIAVLVVTALALVLSIILATRAPVGEGMQVRKIAAIAAVDDAWRAALPRDPEAATRAYLARLSPAQRERSDACFEGKQWIMLWQYVFVLCMMWFLLATRTSAAMRDFAARVTRSGTMQVVVCALLFVALSWVIGLPLAVYADFFREHQYGRCLQLCGAAQVFLREPPGDAKVKKSLEKLRQILCPIECDVPSFTAVGASLSKRAALFTEFRAALKLEHKDTTAQIDH